MTNYELIPIDKVPMISYMIRRITLTCNTAALVPRAVCSCSCIALSCVVKKYVYRPVPSWRQKSTVPCRRGKKSTVPSRRGRNYLPSRPVVKNYTHRPVPSSKKIPFRPVTKQQYHCTVPSRPFEEIHTHRPVPSYLGNHNFHYFTVPSRPPNFTAKHSKTVRSRPVSNITINSHEKPWKRGL